MKPRTFHFLSDHCTTVQREDNPFTHPTKAELPQEGILFRTQFPSLRIFINKKVGFRKN